MPLYKGLEKVCKLAKGTQRASEMGPGIQFYCFGYITLPRIDSTNIYQLQHFSELEMQQSNPLREYVALGPESAVPGPGWRLQPFFTTPHNASSNSREDQLFI